MSVLAAVVSACCAVVLATSAAHAAQSPPAGASGAELLRLVTSVQDADYRGELVRLRALADSMQRYTLSRDLGARARYWRGFAHWRHALNALNDGAGEDSVDQDFAAATFELKTAPASPPPQRRHPIVSTPTSAAVSRWSEAAWRPDRESSTSASTVGRTVIVSGSGGPPRPIATTITRR